MHAYIFTICLLCSFFSTISVAECKETQQKIRKLIKEDKPEALQKALAGLSLKEIQTIANKYQYQPLIDATTATKKVLRRYSNLGISNKNLFQTSFFITTQLPSLTEKYRYLTPKLTGLKDIIEYDPKTKKAFILLDRYDEAYLGKGDKKRVYKSIRFSPRKPKVVARAEQSAPMDTERRMYKRMRNAPGVVKTHAFTSHKQMGKKFQTVYFDLYNPGTFKKSFFKKNKFRLKEMASIVRDVLTGLDSLHSRNLVHRDLHSGNYLISIKKKAGGKKVLHTVIADFGRVIEVEKAKGIPSQGARRFRPPEGIDSSKMKGKDYFASDIYAVGCVFYQLF